MPGRATASPPRVRINTSRPDDSIFIPAAEDFVQGTLSWGTKMADILHAFGIAKAVPGQPFYVSDEAQEKTYKVNVTDSGTISDMQLFADAGGESVTQDKAGDVYLAAGQVQVYSPDGRLIGRIDVPERPIDLVFGGPDHRTLFILTHASLYSVRTKIAGLLATRSVRDSISASRLRRESFATR